MKIKWSTMLLLVAFILVFTTVNGSQASKVTFGAMKYDDGGVDTDFGNSNYDLHAAFRYIDFNSSFQESSNAIIYHYGGLVLGGWARMNGGSHLQPQDKRFALAKINTYGHLVGEDSGNPFGGDGKVITDFQSSTREEILDLAKTSRDKIIAVGFAVVDGIQQFALARYNRDGSLDLSFDSDGKVLSRFGLIEKQIARSVVIDRHSKIVVAGSAWARHSNCIDYSVLNNDGSPPICKKNQLIVARYNNNGSLDTTFGNNGYSLLNIFNTDHEYGYAVAVDQSNNIIVGGYVKKDSDLHFTLARLDSDGKLDTSFGNHSNLYGHQGRVVTDFRSTNSERITAIAIDNDNKILAVGPGKHKGSDKYHFLVARYNTDGSLDSSFDGDGKVRTNFRSVDNEYPMFVMTHPTQSSIIVGGYGEYDNPSTGLAVLTKNLLARYLPNGLLDTSFSGDGKVATATLPTGNFRANDGVFYQGITGLIYTSGSAVVKRQCFDGDTIRCTCSSGYPGIRNCQEGGYLWSQCDCSGAICVPGSKRDCECDNGSIGEETCYAQGRWSDCFRCRDDEIIASESSEIMFLYNRARDSYIDGPVPFVGSFPGVGTINGNLLGISIPEILGEYPINISRVLIVKNGYTTDDCTNDSAVVKLEPGNSTTSEQIRLIFGSNSPPLPITIAACLNSSHKTLPNFDVTIEYSYR